MRLEADIAAFVGHIKNKGLCLQAGGGLGDYPIILSRYFWRVVTVEADNANYASIAKSLHSYVNVEIIHAGLWHESGTGSTTAFRPGMVLTNYIIEGTDFPLITIDSLNLQPDLIWLDIEGSEYKALCGASKTLKTCNAVIIEEANKGLPGNFKDKETSARELLESLGFKPVLKRSLDILFMR